MAENDTKTSMAEPWECGSCGAENPPHRGLCWKCGKAEGRKDLVEMEDLQEKLAYLDRRINTLMIRSGRNGLQSESFLWRMCSVYGYFFLAQLLVGLLWLLVATCAGLAIRPIG